MSISAMCLYETPQPSQSMVLIRQLTAKANMMCFDGLVLPPMTAVGELLKKSVAENSQSSLSALFAVT